MSAYLLTTCNTEDPNNVEQQLNNASIHETLEAAQQEALDMCGTENYVLEWTEQNNIWDAECGGVLFRIKSV